MKKIIDTIKNAAYINELKKIAGYGRDFVAGLDPTGVASSKRARDVAEHNAPHRGSHAASAVAGGVAGGYALGAAIPAAATGAAALITHRANPALSKTLRDTAKGTLSAMHPGHMYKYVKSLGPTFKAMKESGKGINIVQDLKENWHKNPVRSVKKGVVALKHFAKGDKMSSEVAKKHFGKDKFTEGMLKSVTAVTTGLASVGGAGVGGLTAGMQYRQAYKDRDKLNQIKHASFKDELNKIAGTISPESLRVMHESIKAKNPVTSLGVKSLKQQIEDVNKFKIKNVYTKKPLMVLNIKSSHINPYIRNN